MICKYCQKNKTNSKTGMCSKCQDKWMEVVFDFTQNILTSIKLPKGKKIKEDKWANTKDEHGITPLYRLTHLLREVGDIHKLECVLEDMHDDNMLSDYGIKMESYLLKKMYKK